MQYLNKCSGSSGHRDQSAEMSDIIQRSIFGNTHIIALNHLLTSGMLLVLTPERCADDANQYEVHQSAGNASPHAGLVVRCILRAARMVSSDKFL